MCYSALVKRDFDYLKRTYGAVISRQDVDDYTQASLTDPKHYPALHSRIYPGNFAPVIIGATQQPTIHLQRYGAYPPSVIGDPQRYTSYNARRDNLGSRFWSNAFMHQHGFLVLSGFFEWVEVKDLLSAGVVTLKQVTTEFARQAAMRREKILASGKKYKPTPTELKPAEQRKIIIQFQPEDAQDLLVPVIYSASPEPGQFHEGFAIVTDEPPPEIRAAGHDRCPIILNSEGLQAWLDHRGKSAKDLDRILSEQQRITFKHQLAEAA
jgi:putative SOS response-associated peptidase YedK